MSKVVYSMIFTSVLLLIFGWAAWEAYGFQKLASYFPFYISIIAIALCLVEIASQAREYLSAPASRYLVSDKDGARVIIYMLWIIGYVSLILLAGFVLGTVIFLASFLKLETKLTFTKTILCTGATMSVVIVFSNVMNLHFPAGLAERMLGM